MDASQSEKRLNIKKYPNRRYYDATRSRHATLEEIYALIREGYEIQVTDSKSGEDITAKVLAQIIIELDPFKLGVFPVPLLHRLLQSSEQTVSDFARRYFQQMLDAFVNSQRDLQHYWQQMVGFRPPGPTLSDWAKAMWSPMAPAAGAGAGNPPAQSAPSATPPNGAASAAGQEQDDLRRQIDLLGAQLNSLKDRLAPDSRKKRGKKRK